MAMRAVAVGEAGQQPPEVEYSLWRSSIYQLDQDAAADAGFAIGSVKLSGNYRLLVIDVARTAVIKDPVAMRQETWGYGYRLLVEISDEQAVGSLTLPAIAAAVELNQVKASVRLEVNGYVGDGMWGQLPVPRPLDVDTYKDYIAAAGRIQQTFEKDPGNARPVLLAEGDLSQIAQGGVNDTEVREAVVLVGLLRGIAGGIDRERAASGMLSSSDLSEDVIDSLATSVYALLGTDTTGRPSHEAVEAAAALLYPLDR